VAALFEEPTVKDRSDTEIASLEPMWMFVGACLRCLTLSCGGKKLPMIQYSVRGSVSIIWIRI
jgi:hypothetical protein